MRAFNNWIEDGNVVEFEAETLDEAKEACEMWNATLIRKV